MLSAAKHGEKHAELLSGAKHVENGGSEAHFKVKVRAQQTQRFDFFSA